jgi:magnesium-protoporphyrin O-methyltransferase
MQDAHKARIQSYFDGEGFERWRAIYGQGELSGVRRSIRQGHTRMLAQVEQWLSDALTSDGRRPATVLDAGCGTGLLAVALARSGYEVTASDIAAQMVEATRSYSLQSGVAGRVSCVVGDLEVVSGRYDVVSCLDVLIHYPQPSFGRMLARLAQLTHRSLLFTYAPREPLLAALHWVGGRFPKAQRRTDIQLIDDKAVQACLHSVGMSIKRSARISSGFYHVNLVEAMRD